MAITGKHSNFAAQAYIARGIRAGTLEDRDYTIEEAERLYARSDEQTNEAGHPVGCNCSYCDIHINHHGLCD